MSKRNYRNKVIDNAIRNMLHMSEDQLRAAKNHLLHAVEVFLPEGSQSVQAQQHRL